MDKSNPSSEHDKEMKHQQAARAEMQGAAGSSRNENASERTSGGKEQAIGNAMSTAGRVSSGVVGGVTNVAADLVHGVGTIGGEVVTVVRDTANTAIAGVGSIGETAVHTVTGLLADLVGGLRDIGSSAMRGRTQADMDRESRSQEARRRPEEAMH